MAVGCVLEGVIVVGCVVVLEGIMVVGCVVVLVSVLGFIGDGSFSAKLGKPPPPLLNQRAASKAFTFDF